MRNERWPFTSRLIGPEPGDDGEDLTMGMSLLRALARDPRNGLTEVSPGRYLGSAEHDPLPVAALDAALPGGSPQQKQT